MISKNRLGTLPAACLVEATKSSFVVRRAAEEQHSGRPKPLQQEEALPDKTWKKIETQLKKKKKNPPNKLVKNWNPRCCLSWCAWGHLSAHRRGNHFPSWLFHSVPSLSHSAEFVPLFDPFCSDLHTGCNPPTHPPLLYPVGLPICLICFWMLASSFCCGFFFFLLPLPAKPPFCQCFNWMCKL